jgi:hypothetical protein
MHLSSSLGCLAVRFHDGWVWLLGNVGSRSPNAFAHHDASARQNVSTPGRDSPPTVIQDSNRGTSMLEFRGILGQQMPLGARGHE